MSASTVCFHYGDDGERCRARCLDPSFFLCATHLHEYLHTDTAKLLKDAATSIVACTVFTEQALPSLHCKDLTSWKRLCNTLAALSCHGYHDDAELLTALVSSIESVSGGWQRKGKPFERLVTRLYLEELAPLIRGTSRTDSVRVLWNRKLPSLAGGKRQIDVILRSQCGSDVSDTIVECRDHEVEVGEMDGFATLIRRVQASRGVMVTSVGFQKGALDSAAFDGIETRVVTESDFGDDEVSRTVDDLYAFEAIANRLDSATDGKPISRARILERHIDVMRNGIVTGTLAELMSHLIDTKAPDLGSLPPHVGIETPGLRVLFPGGQVFDVSAFHVFLKIVEQRRVCKLMLPRRPVAFAIASPNGTTRKVSASDVPLLSTPTFETNRFYVNVVGQTYYCERVDAAKDSAFLILLNDRQHDGSRLDVEFETALDEAQRYYPVVDVGALSGLHAQLNTFQSFRAPTAQK